MLYYVYAESRVKEKLYILQSRYSISITGTHHCYVASGAVDSKLVQGPAGIEPQTVLIHENMF